MRNGSQSQGGILKGTLDMIILRAPVASDAAEGHKQLVRETSRWRLVTSAVGLVMGQEGRAQ